MIEKNEIKKLKIYTLKQLYKMRQEMRELKKKRDWLSVKEVETEFVISRKTIDRMREKGLKVSQPKRNGKILINRNELETFLNTKS